MGLHTGAAVFLAVPGSPRAQRTGGAGGSWAPGGKRKRVLFEHGYAVALYAQCVLAILIGMRILPLPSASSVPKLSEVAVASGFITLSGLVAVLLRRRRKEQKDYAEALHHAFHDAGTDLPNRAAMERTMTDWLERQHPFSCLCIQIDVPDAHSGGYADSNDALTQSILLRLQPFVVNGAVLGRLSSDRFLLLLSGVHSRSSLSIRAEEILQALAPAHNMQSSAVTTSAIMGIAIAYSDANDWVGLLKAAKHAMAVARSEERNIYRFAADTCATTRSVAISGKLQRALLEGALQLVYQPIYNSEGQMVAAEALARWYDEEQGQISPAEFVPVAEATGLIIPLSKWVLRQACKQMAEWCSMGSPIQRIAVNVSVKQVCRKDFVQTIQQTLRDAGLRASCLELEVTEGALASDFEAVKQNLLALRTCGVRISIDDFGTGYSSLGRVRELNADVLKIDRVFTQGATESEGGAAMVRAIIDMAHTLQLSVVAEGIETKEQMSILRAMRCDEMQGYLLARPQTPDALTVTFQQKIPAQKQGQRPVRMVPRPAAMS